ncbi:exodeoxyribonuclease V subunit gamma [Rhodanobacter sp. 115]|nr:exodeoxyribonuclease V subunit gamma [Rhodanobacter sp. 115]
MAHNRQREVEVLHDNLLAMFEQAERDGQPLAPREVMVMVPDIQAYAPHIQAVFGRLPMDDPRFLPCSIADRPGRGTTPLLVALEQLLRLPESRYASGDILDLLDTPALRRRFGLDESGLPTLRRWIEGAGIRWGLDGAQKANLGLPPEEQNSWRFGLRRMLLGYAVGDGQSLHGIAPFDEVGGLDAALVGPLALLMDALDQHGRQLATSATPSAWGQRLRALLATFFDEPRRRRCRAAAAPARRAGSLGAGLHGSRLRRCRAACRGARTLARRRGRKPPVAALHGRRGELRHVDADARHPVPRGVPAGHGRRRLPAQEQRAGFRPDGHARPAASRRPLAPRGRPLSVPGSAACRPRPAVCELGGQERP